MLFQLPSLAEADRAPGGSTGDTPARVVPRVLASVLNYNSFEQTVETLECLHVQDYPRLDIQLVDNKSTTDCVSKLRRRFPALTIIEADQNRGYTGGNNLALDIALEQAYDYILVCNQDIAIGRRFVSMMMEAACARPNAGVIGCIEECCRTGVVRVAGGKGFNLWLGRTRWFRRFDRTEAVMRVGCVQGACLAVSKLALRSGLRFDERLFMYVDEADLGLQLKRSGLEAVVATRCRVRHKAQPSRFAPRVGYLIQRNRLLVALRYGRLYTLVFNVVYTATLELPLKWLIRSAQGHGRFARACVSGFFDALFSRVSQRRIFAIHG